jgi:arabinogalactan endo-1,4-beta-galactosidase
MAGVDISSLPVHEDHNAIYRDGGVAGDAIEIFTENGVNWVRLRLFVEPSNDNDDFVVQDIPYTIALAQRVKSAGAKVLLDFHYSDTWADPGKQHKPQEWLNLNYADLRQQVYDYTKASIEDFDQAGVLPEMVQIGNEISSGMLWNDDNRTASNSGYPWTGGSHNTGFDRLAGLLEAGIDGARDGAPDGKEPLVMIHSDKGAEWGTSRFFFDKLTDRNLDFDVIGYSYYPKFHYDDGDGDVDAVTETLVNSADRYNKPVVLVEAGFPSRCPQCEPDYEFDVSPEGQAEYLRAMVDAVQSVPNNMGWGVFWWYAEARPTSGLNVWEGGRLGLFDQNGNALPALDAFNDVNLPGDYTGDGLVNSEDLQRWASTFGATGNFLAADGDEDGDVDGDDVLHWLRNYNGELPAAVRVPEPSAAFLLGLASLLVPGRSLQLLACSSVSMGRHL